MHSTDKLTMPDVVEDQMALVRARLRRDGEACQQAKEHWSDWRTHVRAHPWLACGVAAALGYVLVPGRRSTATPALPALNETLPPPRRESSLLGRLAAELGRRAAQQAIAGGTAWAMAKLSARHLNQMQDGDPGEYRHEPVPAEYAP
jgi:hypothetical protein